MLAAHPELRQLAGPLWTTGAWTIGFVSAQIGLALLVANRSWLIWLPTAYLAGPTLDHALWVLIHDCCHNLVSHRRWVNRATALIANLPMVVPAAMSFCKYHLLHHRHLGEQDLDADLAGPTESRIVGQSSVRKMLWLASMSLVLGTIRPRRMKGVPLVDRWIVINAATQLVVISVLIWWAGAAPLKYLLASTILAV